jgi:chromosome segregation ATPase
VYARELEVGWKEKRLAKKEEALNQREEVVTELSAKLSAMNGILEEQRIQQIAAMERLQKLQQELEGKARDAALAEKELKAKGESLDRREMDLARREMDLARREKDLSLRRKCLKGGRSCWPSMSSRRRRRSGRWRSGSAGSRRHQVPRQWRR